MASTIFASSAHAITISPVMIELSNARRIVSVTISNPSDQAISFQAETLAWSQPDGSDHYQPTDALIVAPPISEIPPNSSQIFRIALRVPSSNTVERAYRLVLEDVSEALTPQPGVVAIRFKHNLPVFVIPSSEAEIALRWRRCAATPGQGCVRLDNEGSRRIRFIELVVAGQGWQKAIRGGTVLAESWRQWHFDLPAGKSQPASISAKTDQGAISADMP